MSPQSLIDPKKKEIVLQRIKDGKSPFCAEKPVPEALAAEAQSADGKTISVPNFNLVILSQKMSYTHAWNEAIACNKRIVSHTLHDDYLTNNNLWRPYEKYYPAWCREWLVYPKKDGVFKPGKDVKDTHELNGERWRVIFPASHIPQQAINVKGVGLFIDPTDIDVNTSKRRLIVHTTIQSVITLNGFMQEDGWGQADTNTRIPLSVPEDVLNALADNQKRYLWRVDGNGIRPLARGGGSLICNVYANSNGNGIDWVFGVFLMP